jgi:hypothetical protein
MDKERIKNLAQNPDFISGIYNYCDRWCERCAFTSRCMNFAMGKEFCPDQASQDARNEDFWEAMSRIFEVTMELLYDLAEEKGIDLDQAMESLDAEQEDRQRNSVDNNICSILARKYAKMAGMWLEANESLLVCQDEQLKIPGVVSVLESVNIKEALEIVCWYQHLIYVKVNRALYGKMQASEDSLEDDQYDANGSAKVALIGIEKSIAAWSILHSFYGQYNSQLQEILFYLERLRRKVMNLFPGAQSFIRPGFDG